MQPLEDNLWKDLLTLASDARNTVVVMTGRERGLVSQASAGHAQHPNCLSPLTHAAPEPLPTPPTPAPLGERLNRGRDVYAHGRTSPN
jgi:hypothetical protein